MNGDLKAIFENLRYDHRYVLRWDGTRFFASRKTATHNENRFMLGHFYRAYEGRRGVLRQIWREEAKGKPPSDLPAIVGEDNFLRMYARGASLPIPLFRKMWRRLEEEELSSAYPSIQVAEMPPGSRFYGVKATPPGVLPKFLTRSRMRKDQELLAQIQSDLRRIAQIEDFNTRKWVTLAVLSHGAAYRELEGKVLYIPCLHHPEEGKLIPYAFRQHLIWEGVKTVSATPLEREFEEPGLYLCQGTEIWPSQPSVLGSLYANLGKEGAATEPYAHAWRQIHRHLRALHKKEGPLPLVAGHSLGGALANQIALYSHPLIAQSYAYNPPVVEERDFRLYHRLSPEVQHKLFIFANLDDLPFWRIGSKVIGHVFVLLSSKRWTYFPIRLWEVILVLPALVKTCINLVTSFPAHQSIFALNPQYLVVPLTQKEIDRENTDRQARFDRLTFITKFHSPARRLLRFVRSHFTWAKKEEHLRNQLELLEIHEQDLLETSHFENGPDISRELAEVRRQIASLKSKLS